MSISFFSVCITLCLQCIPEGNNVVTFTLSCTLVSLVYNELEQGPISFIELLFYAVGLLSFTF